MILLKVRIHNTDKKEITGYSQVIELDPTGVISQFGQFLKDYIKRTDHDASK